MEKERKLMFTNAYFGKLYLNRMGEKVAYLETAYFPKSETCSGFTVVHVAAERHVKYEDGSEKTYHVTYHVNEYGEVDRFTHSKNEEDIVREYWEGANEETLNKMTDDASSGLIEGTEEWRMFRLGFKWGFREGINYHGGNCDE